MQKVVGSSPIIRFSFLQKPRSGGVSCQPDRIRMGLNRILIVLASVSAVVFLVGGIAGWGMRRYQQAMA